MNENLSYSSEVRKNILNMLMFSLYSDERTIYREYVQNALDSINRAVRLHVLPKAKDGVVSVDIDSKQRSITIRDNGTGIQASEAVQVLLDISYSTKDGIVEAGQFGIGRLVGGGYCHELVFITSAMGENVATKITFDIDKIWKMVKEDEENYLATTVINQCTNRELVNAKEEEHFFEVQLKNVKHEYASILLNTEEVVSYLNSVAPVEYKSQFDNVLIYGSTEHKLNFRSLHEGLEKVQLFVGKTRIQKQYGLEIVGNHDKIDSLEYFKVTDPDFGELGWGWFALTKYTVQIPKEDALAGIRLRIHNIQIGDANLLSGKPLWSEDRGNSYFYGEVFATHPNIRPDSSRNGLAPTSESKAFYAALEVYFKELKQLYTKANEAKKAIEHILEGVDLLTKRGLDDYKGWDEIDNKGIAKFEQVDKKTLFEPAQRMLELYRPSFEEAKLKVDEIKKKREEEKKATKPIQTSPTSPCSPTSSPQPSINIQESGTKVGDTTTNPHPSDNSEPSNSPVYPVNNPSQPVLSPKRETPSTNTSPITIPPSQPTKPLKSGDILSSLNGIFDKNEVWIIRRVFKVLNENCPNNDHDRRLIEELKQLIVKEFSNGI